MVILDGEERLSLSVIEEAEGFLVESRGRKPHTFMMLLLNSCGVIPFTSSFPA
jgi:hypothetical protein